MFTLFTGAELYYKGRMRKCDVLCTSDKILRVGEIDHKKLFQLGIEVQVVNLNGNFLLPGIIDPHMHVLGGSGENGGFSSQSPEISATEIVESGVTTVVGTLGVDTTMKTMPGLLAKIKGLNEEGINAFMWCGGYDVPPVTVLENIKDDIMFISEIIGAGEIAIADERSVEPTPKELARVIVDSHNGGMLAGKCGLTHFHVGAGKRQLQCILDTLEFAPDINPEWLYPTHINRNPKLMRKAIQLSKKGSFLDMDTTEENLQKSLDLYIDEGGDLDKLTLSSDAGPRAPSTLITQVQKCLRGRKFKLKDIWKLVSTNTANILKMRERCDVDEGNKPNFIVLDRSSYELLHVFSSGKFFIKDGTTEVKEKFLEESNREIELIGEDVSKEHHPSH